MNSKFDTGSDWLTRLAWGIIFSFGFIAIFADFIANDTPLYASKNAKRYWPVLQKVVNHAVDYSTYDYVLYPPIPFRHQGVTNLTARLKPPGTEARIFGVRKHHLLGTDRLGRDVAAGLVFGCRKSLWIAMISISIASLIGIFLGALAGFWGNRMPLHVTWYSITLAVMGSFYIGFLLYYHTKSSAILAGFLLFALLIALFSFTKQKIYLPMDAFVLRLLELFQSVPGLLILMVMAALVKQPSLLLLSIIIALVRWTGFARYSRSEVLKIRSRDYITAAEISGIRPSKILTKYIMPEAFGPLVVVFAFGLSSVILLESTLSFLGIGIPVDEVTWGTILSQAKQSPESWWLAVFPGLCILAIVFSINLVGDNLKRRFDAKD